jgi:hypothetical protein
MPRAWLLLSGVAAVLLSLTGLASSVERRLDGFNVIASPGHPFGTASAQRSLQAAKQMGAKAVAIIPFLWQPDPSSADIARGNDMPDDEIRAAIRQARALGLAVVVKPHVWVPQSWAGAIEPQSEEAWRRWFAAYGAAIEPIARLAAEEKADAFSIGTELSKTTHRPEWIAVIAAARAAFPGTLLYVAHNAEEAERVPFWGRLDMVGISLYPPLGDDADRTGRIASMHILARRLEAISAVNGKPVLVAEIGLRSAEGAAKKPWESAEERAAKPDPRLQADVIADWLEALKQPAIKGVLVWRWFTDPAAGGGSDTDFTVQGKPAQAMLRCAWTAACPSD